MRGDGRLDLVAAFLGEGLGDLAVAREALIVALQGQAGHLLLPASEGSHRIFDDLEGWAFELCRPCREVTHLTGDRELPARGPAPSPNQVEQGCLAATISPDHRTTPCGVDPD